MNARESKEGILKNNHTVAVKVLVADYHFKNYYYYSHLLQCLKAFLS